MNYKFKYGNDYLSIPLNTKAAELIYGEISPITDIEKEINHCLDNPIASQPFDEIFRRGDKVVIVTSNITRLWINLIPFYLLLSND